MPYFLDGFFREAHINGWRILSVPDFMAWSGPGGAITLTLTGALIGVAGLVGYRAWKAAQVPPEERERRRRSLLVASGKMGDAILVEIRENLLFFSYHVRGLEYTASQDVSRLEERIPRDLSELGPVCVKYDPRNPADSIVVAENWSGLRAGKAE